MTWTVLDLGPAPEDGVERWGADQRIRRVIRVTNPAPTGRRLGSRALGLGVDALRVAFRARLSSRPGPLIAMNPWTAVMSRLLGLDRVCSVGLYAVEGGRSWRLLRRILGQRPVVTLSEHEATRWRLAGGRARAVRYGATFEALESDLSAQPGRVFSVFIGGSSDRDLEGIRRLTAEVENAEDVRLVIAAGGVVESDTGRVRRLKTLRSSEFSRQLAQSDVVYLPLADNGRAAGHMVLVEALQRGKPVVATWVSGMDEYFDGEYVTKALPDLLPQLRETASRFSERSGEITDYWRHEYSKTAFGARILNALEAM